MKKWLIRRFVQWVAPRLRFIVHNPDHFKYCEAQGYHVTPVHFYQPIPDTRELAKRYPGRSALTGIEWHIDEQLHYLCKVFPQYAADTHNFACEKLDEETFYLDNGQFVGIDPHIYYCMIRQFCPKHIIEVGAGFSTLVAAQAAKFLDSVSITAIEPYPREFIAQGIHGIEHIPEKVEDVPITRFEQLQANDILFIDSSHVIRTGGDVCHLILNVLPQLQSGVIVHVHDIFLPYDYPQQWTLQDQTFWTEQYLIQAYLIHNQRVHILLANHFLEREYAEDLKRIFPYAQSWTGGSLWFRV